MEPEDVKLEQEETTGQTDPQDFSKYKNLVLIDPQGMFTHAGLDGSLFSSEYEVAGIPGDWKEKAQKAWEYYTQEPIVSNTINTWRTFAIGDEVKLSCDDEKVGTEAQSFFSERKINRFVKDMILQLLVKGECVGYKRYGKNGKPKDGDSDEITKLLCLNPTSVDFEHDNGELVKVIQKPPKGTTGEEKELALAQMLHLKWNAPQFAARGNSMVLPAFESIELMRDYRRAARAIAKRWTSPLRFILVGGKFGDKVIMPNQRMLTEIQKSLNKMNPKTGAVMPFYVRAETYGAEGHVLNTEEKVKEVKEDIIVALGVAKSLVTGDGPNFATAAIAFQKMVIMLKEIKQAAREIMDWIFDDWRELKGYDRKLQYIFSDVDLNDEVKMKKLLLELYDRDLISKATIQTKMDLNPDVEKGHRDKEIQLSKAKPGEIAALVQLEIISKEEAREALGMNGKGQKPEAEAQEDAENIYAKVENS